MSISQLLLPEYDQETSSTRQVLALVRDELFPWRAGPNFQSIGWNANHLSEIPDWVAGTMNQIEWDLSPPGGPAYESPKSTSIKKVLEVFDQNVSAGREAIAAAKDDDFPVMWSLLKGGQTLFAMPRYTVIRSFVLNHMVHHRSHLLVYLRLNGIQTPGMYGPGPELG